MQTPWRSLLLTSLDSRPNVGRLVELCEDNYSLLQRLVPDLRAMRGTRIAQLRGHADLHLEVLEHSRYTRLIHLTYYFESGAALRPEPDAVLRVYHDSAQLEVVELRQADSVLSTMPLYEVPGLSNKWQLNWFVSKWLGYCVALGYRFQSTEPVPGEGLPADLPE